MRLDENDGSAAAAAPDTSGLVYEPAAEAGLRQLLASDRNFDAGRFMEGAEAAYRNVYAHFTWDAVFDKMMGIINQS